jgi:hypothetical protein
VPVIPSDRVDGVVGRAFVEAASIERYPWIDNHNLRAARRQFAGMATTDTSPCTGEHGDPPMER